MRWPLRPGPILALLVLVTTACAAPDSADEDVGEGAGEAEVVGPAADAQTATGRSTDDPGEMAESERQSTGDDRGGTERADRPEAAASDPVDGENDPAAVVVRSGGLDEAFIQLITSLDGVAAMAVIGSGQVRMTASEDRFGRPVDRLPAGFVMQLEARSYADPAAIEPFSIELAEALAGLQPDELILSRSSAELRRLDVGGSIEFETGVRFRVAAVVPDTVAGRAEVVLAGPDALDLAGGGSSMRRAALVDFDGTGEDLEAILLEANGGEGIRVFGGRGGDDELDRQRSTLSQIEVKQVFGEFAFRPTGSRIEIEPGWIEANLVTVDLPLLGPARCHRVFARSLEAVLQGLVDDGLGDLIDPGAFQGCWNPRTIAGSARLSKHAWGIAADINFGNPLDEEPGSPVHPELLARMEDAGFVSGHVWTTPDPGHFEYRRPGS